MRKKEEVVKVIPGDIAWLIITLFIINWDVYSVTTNKAETMSGAIWRSLSHPKKFPLAITMWFLITWHLFFNPKARAAYKLIWLMHNSRLIKLERIR